MDSVKLTARQYGFLFALLGVVIVVLFLHVGYQWYEKKSERGSEAATLLKESVESPYSTLEGVPFSFAPYKGKVRVVNVWASWSPQTAAELPILEAAAVKYANRGVVAIAVNRKESRDRAQAYLATQPTYTHITYVIDETDAFYASVGGYAMPETIIFAADGSVAWHYRGVLTGAALTEQLERVLNN